MNNHQVRKKLESRPMPFPITDDLVGKVARMMRRHKRQTGQRFTLSVPYLTYLSRVDIKQRVIRRLRVVAGLVEDQDRAGNPYRMLWLSVIELAIQDMAKGQIDIRNGVKTNAHFETAMTFFESDQFDLCCWRVDIDPEWAFALIRELCFALVHGATISVNR